MDEYGGPLGGERYAVLPPRADLIEEVADRLSAEGVDFSGQLVVFPGKRPAHFLRRTIAVRMGSSFIPPVILSMEELVDDLYGKIDPAAPAKMEAVDALAFLFEIHRGMARPLGGDQFLSLDAFLPLGLRIYRDLEELLIEGVEPRQLRAVEPFMESPLPPQACGSLQSLSFFYERFYEVIEKAGFASRSQRYARVSSEIGRALLPYQQIVLAGFYALTHCEKRLFRELLTWENVRVLFREGPGLAARLGALGIEYDPPVRSDDAAPGQGPRITFSKSPDAHGQVLALSALLKEEMERGPEPAGAKASGSPAGPEGHCSTVIVLPSPESLFPVLYHALPLVPGGRYNISLTYPLERTAAWGFLSSLMQLIMSVDEARLYIPDYLGFVLHPYTKNIYLEGRTEATRILFHTLEEVLLKDRTRSFVTLDELEGNTEVFRLAAERLSGTEASVEEGEIGAHLKRVHDELIRRASAFDDVGDFAEKMSGILTFIYDHSSARLHPFFHPFVESFLEELDLLRGSRISSLSFAERNSYFHFFKGYVGHCSAPFEGTPLQGVQVLGFLETRGLRFERTYVIDANEDILPDTRKEESLLPFKVREILGLPTYVDRDLLSAYHFETLVKGSQEVHLFFAENDRKEKSRFVERLLWERQKAEGAEAAGGFVRSIAYRLSLEHELPPPIPKTPSVAAFLRTMPYDATGLDVYLNCPLQFYYRSVLGLSKRAEVSTEIEKVDVGRLVHKALLRYFEKRLGRRLTEAEIDPEEMGAIVAALFEEAYGPGPIGPAYLLRRQITRQMEAFLLRYQAVVARRTPVVIRSLERRISVSAMGFTFRGIVDRIETRGGATCIVDYKTGSSARGLVIEFDRLDPDERATWDEAIGSLQLPFYIFLYGESAGTGIEGFDAHFLLLGRTQMDEGIEVPLFSREDRRAEDYAKAKEVIGRLVREIADPDLPFGPLHRAKDSCLFCDYQHLCGMHVEAR
jgi:CRISPR/Cas system-associated exonuclease Cas4 (RecB family)